MKIALDWLKEYVDINLSTAELSHVLTMGGLEIESVEWVELPDGRKTEVIELNVTPNRGYCLSFIGVAREVASLLSRPCRLPSPLAEIEKKMGSAPVTEKVSVVNEEAMLCPRYSAMIVENVSVGPSPQWLADRLLAVGLRPINNVVDVTNYVMMEYGQPLHAFDHALLASQSIVVRRARKDEPFAALDGSQIKLDSDALVIADAEKPVALAGVMGGANSQVSGNTKAIVLESACFDPTVVRKASKKYALRSESSYRFERGVDIEGVITVQSRAALLIHQLAGGTIRAGRIDIYPSPRTPNPVSLRVSRVNKVLGSSFGADKIAALIERLGFNSEKQTVDEFLVQVPSFRPTLAREIDLIEEVARLSGYDSIAVARPLAAINPVRIAPKQECVRKIKETLCHIGYSEVINYSFIDETLSESFKTACATAENANISLSNPISAEMKTMRSSLIPGLLATSARNLSKGQKPIKIFEVGNIYYQSGKETVERTLFAALVTGPYENNVWKPHGKNYDYYDLKGTLETAMAQFKLMLEYRPARREFLTPGKTVECLAGDSVLGYMGELSPQQTRQWELGQNACVLEIDVERLAQALPPAVRFVPIPKYPEIYRDISILINKTIPSKEVTALIQAAGAPLLGTVELYDCFEGKKLEEGKRSLTFALSFQSHDKTLTDDEVNPLFDRIVKTLGEKYGATLRSV